MLKNQRVVDKEISDDITQYNEKEIRQGGLVLHIFVACIKQTQSITKQRHVYT